MSALTPRRAAQIEADPPCITFGEVRRLIAASKVNDDLVAALKEADAWLYASLGLVCGEGPPNWDGIREHRKIISALLAKAEAQS